MSLIWFISHVFCKCHQTKRSHFNFKLMKTFITKFNYQQLWFDWCFFFYDTKCQNWSNCKSDSCVYHQCLTSILKGNKYLSIWNQMLQWMIRAGKVVWWLIRTSQGIVSDHPVVMVITTFKVLVWLKSGMKSHHIINLNVLKTVLHKVPYCAILSNLTSPFPSRIFIQK